METGAKPVEDNPAPKSTGSLVQISSIYIDLRIPVEKNETESCQHNFSIRGYAAEMRRKNPKASMPFPLNANLNNIEEQLPPMSIPKFRWWRCPECRRKIENDSAAEETTVHSSCCTCSTPLNGLSNGETTMTLSVTQRVPTAQRSEGIRDVDINAPPSHQETNDCASVDVAATGCNTGPVELVNDKAGATRDEETSSENVITTGDNKRLPELENNDECNREILRELQQSTDGDATPKKMEVAADGTVNSVGFTPFQVEECGNASTESDQNKKHESSTGVSRRKRKLRYLTELLGDKGNLRSDHLKADVSSVHPKFAASSGSGTLVSEGQAPCEDIGKATKSPQRKRKLLQEEPEGITDPGIIGTNGSMPKADSERTVTDNAIGSSEGRANASSVVRLQIVNKNDRSNRKTEKTPAVVKRKSRPIQLHDRFSPRPGEQSSSKNNVKGGDLPAATANTLFRSLETSSAAGETEKHTRNSQSPQVPEWEKGDCTQTASQISKSQPSQSKVGLDLSLNSFAVKNDSSGNKKKASTSKSVFEKNDIHFGQCSMLPTSELDLSQQKSQFWDLNERIAQNSASLVEKRNLSPMEEKSCHKEKTSEAEERPKEINKQSDQMGSNRMARGSSDDIPMEIVELMAKNQYERGLPDGGNNSFRHRISNNMGRFSEVQGMGPIAFTKGFPALTSFSSANARSGLAIGGNSVNYSEMNRNHFDICNPEKNKVSIFDIFPQTQQMLPHGLQYPASASVRTGSQHSERREILSSSRAPNVSFGLGIQPKYPAQNPELHHRGKTISDIKADEMKKTQDAHIILSKPGNSDLTSKPKGPVDPYVNDNIPAMQLLSLMNGRSPSTTFNMGSGKPFAPCSHHPRYSTTERRDFLNASLFQRQSGLGTSTLSIGENSGRGSGQHSFGFSGRQEEDQSYLVRYSSCIPYTAHASSRGKDKQISNIGASDCILYLQKHPGRRLLSLEDESFVEEVQPLRIIPPEEQNCMTNLNPAELILLDAEEIFTISWKDLKFPKRKYSRENSCNGTKRQRVAKPKAGKEHPQNPSS